VRTTVASFGLAALAFACAAPLSSQSFATDARRVGMGGVSLTVDRNLLRYNPAYRAVPSRQFAGQAKLTIPIPLGLIQFFGDHPISGLSKDPLFNPDSAAFNPVQLLDLILDPPLFYQLRKPPTPTNNVNFTIGKDNLVVDLGETQELIPADRFGIAGSIRPLDIEPGFKGVHLGVMFWLHDQVQFQLGDSLLALLKEAHPAQHQTLYDLQDTAIVQGGIAPSIGYSGRLYGNDQRALYIGVSAHYYMGVAYGRSSGSAGFTTGDTIFAGPNVVTPSVIGQTSYSKWGNSMGHGVGADVGLAWVSGPIVFGIGMNDIGATITWPDTRVDSLRWDKTQNKVVTYASQLHVETKTKLPVSYLANVIYTLAGTTVGADVLNNGLGTTVHVGAEQRFGPFALRGGVSRDQRKLVQFGWGGGLRAGPIGFDVGFWTNSASLSDQRGITLATSISIY
jgi:hypothetical protein